MSKSRRRTTGRREPQRARRSRKDPQASSQAQRHQDRQSQRELWGLASLFLVVSIAACILLASRPFIHDERLHWRQIALFLNGRFVNYLPMIAGYHAVVAGFARLTGLTSPVAVRLFNLVLGMLSIFVFYRAAHILDPGTAVRRAGLYYLIPILFPLFFLLYTEALSVLLILLAVWAYLRGRALLAGLMASVSILARQNNVVWLALLFVMTYYDQHGFRVNVRHLGSHLRECWTYLIGAVGFVVFVIVNRGVSIDASPEPFEMMTRQAQFAVHAENLFFSLVVIFAIWMPLLLARSVRLVTIRRPSRWLLLTVILAGALYMAFFAPNHPWNVRLPILGNTLLAFAQQSPARKLLLFIPMAIAICWLWTTPLARRSMYFLYVFWAVSLLPVWLVQPRYYVTPLVLLLLFRSREEPRIERATLAYDLVLSGAVFWGMIQKSFFI
jgi:alpha-1,2-glucosyltransferase